MTRRHELMLAALAAGESSSEMSPVQTQKLFFLIDQNVSDAIGGALFNFRPYDYGPFDSAIYGDLDWLSFGDEALVEINRDGRHRTYRLTERGQQVGLAHLANLDPETRDYLGRAKDWVKSLSFQGLVRAIYQAYPEMRANSIFRG